MKKDIVNIIKKLTWLWLIIFFIIIAILYFKFDLYSPTVFYIIFLFFIPLSLITFFFQNTKTGKKRYIFYAVIIGTILGLFLIAIQFPIGMIALIVDTVFSPFYKNELNFESIWWGILFLILPYTIILTTFIAYKYATKK